MVEELKKWHKDQEKSLQARQAYLEKKEDIHSQYRSYCSINVENAQSILPVVSLIDILTAQDLIDEDIEQLLIYKKRIQAIDQGLDRTPISNIYHEIMSFMPEQSAAFVANKNTVQFIDSLTQLEAWQKIHSKSYATNRTSFVYIN
jgi:2-succinyl-5-enolpyruvyl-6-hydroxy-3-cyclohexene-1-carboxylate synthase